MKLNEMKIGDSTQIRADSPDVYYALQKYIQDITDNHLSAAIKHDEHGIMIVITASPYISTFKLSPSLLNDIKKKFPNIQQEGVAFWLK
jgi:hypothetical protein